ncbi:MAG: transketolase family protein [Atribacterota bacterium]
MNTNIPCRKMFTDTLLELAKVDSDIIGITSDARGSVTLGDFAEQLPNQFVEIGIAEQNEVSIAAGLAACGKKPFVCAPASFLSARSLEQIKIDVAYSNTNIKIIGVSGGVSYGPLGSSHHSLHDIAAIRAIPGISVILPCDIYQTKRITEILVNHIGPVYVRMGRNIVKDVYKKDHIPFKIGIANKLLEGTDLTIIGTGETVSIALEAGLLLKDKGISARVIDMHTLKPLDNKVIIEAAKETGNIITIEEHSIFGGLGGAVSEQVSQYYPVPIKIIGIPDEPAITGNSSEVFEYYGLTVKNILDIAIKMVS